jgi:hypothetical protein
MQDHTDESDARSACPPWCAREHRPGLHPDDQHHASRSRRVALVTGDPVLDPDDLAVPDAVVARLVRRTHSQLTWLEVVSEEGRDIRMVATLDSAHRLLAVLHDLLTTASTDVSTDR